MGLTALAALWALGLPVTADDSKPKGRDPRAELVHWFEGKPPTQQKQVLATLDGVALEMGDPYLQSLRAFAERAKSAPLARRGFQETQKVSPDGSFPLRAELPFPLRIEYVYGAAILRKLEPAGASVQKQTPSKQLLSLLDGHLNDLDYALAELMREMDNDESAQPFAMFLESWRNGEESFYRALDRTAGTKQGVFFFDAMLGEFSEKIVKKLDPKAGAKSLNQLHDDLHQAFLTYRQYRGMREAIALSVVLPPDVRLPKNLQRYEEAPAGLQSLRDHVSLMLALSGQSFDHLVTAVRSTAPPLPQPLWSGGYAPVEVTQKALVAGMATQGLTAQALLAQQREMRTSLRSRLAEAVKRKLGEVGFPLAEKL
ncbi:MAG: hypothetical protein JNJ88_13745 [Planctomycetes bacterium]|nr:hypothetical protein [Planctomycetota bacterium]